MLEVPAPADGVLKEIRCRAARSVTSGQVLAIIEEGAAAATTPAAAPAPHRAGSRQPAAPGKAPPSQDRERRRRWRPGRRPSSVRRSAPGRGESPRSGSDRRHRARRPPHQGRRGQLSRQAAGGTRRAPAAPRRRLRPARHRRRRARRAARADDAHARAHRRAPDAVAVDQAHAHDRSTRSTSPPVMELRKRYKERVREGARRQARLHVLLRQGRDRGAEALPGRQRLGRRQRHHLPRLLRHRRRGVDRRGLVVPVLRDARRHELRRHREGDRRVRAQGARGHAHARGPDRAAPSPSPTAACSARCCPRRSSTRRRAPSSACTRSRSAPMVVERPDRRARR